MLILPVLNKNTNTIFVYELYYNNASKVRKKVFFNDADSSEIIVNREKYSKSSFYHDHNIDSATKFIRSRSLVYRRPFLVTTKSERDSDYYDVYKVEPIEFQENDVLDNFFGKLILDYLNEIPGTERRGRYVSLESLGFSNILSFDKIASFIHIVKQYKDSPLLDDKLKKANVFYIKELIDFFQLFDFVCVEDNQLDRDTLQKVVDYSSILKTNLFSELNRHDKIASSNTEILSEISYLSEILYDKKLHFITSEAYQLVKKKNSERYFNAA